MLCLERGIIEYQVRQTPAGADILATGSAADEARVQQEIASELRRLGVGHPRVTFQVVDALERQPTAKMRRFVPLASVNSAAERTSLNRAGHF